MYFQYIILSILLKFIMTKWRMSPLLILFCHDMLLINPDRIYKIIYCVIKLLLKQSRKDCNSLYIILFQFSLQNMMPKLKIFALDFSSFQVGRMLVPQGIFQN